MIWLDMFNRHTAVWSFVFNVLDKTTERPDVMPVSVRQSLTDIGQVLEHDHVAVVGNCFVNDLVGDCVDILFAP